MEHDYDFEIRAFPKIAGEAHVYCRAVNAIIEDGDQICKSCPLATATSDRCRYFRNVTMIPMETNIKALPEMMNRMIAQGAESRFPRFLASSDTLKPYRTVERALQYAADAHAGLFRKGTHLPYIIHPIEVSMIVRDARQGFLENSQAGVLGSSRQRVHGFQANRIGGQAVEPSRAGKRLRTTRGRIMAEVQPKRSKGA